MKVLIACSESPDGSPKKSTFEMLAEAAVDGTGEVELNLDEELGVSTIMGDPGDPSSAMASVVRMWHLAEKRDPDNAVNKGSLELDDSCRHST